MKTGEIMIIFIYGYWFSEERPTFPVNDLH